MKKFIIIIFCLLVFAFNGCEDKQEEDNDIKKTKIIKEAEVIDSLLIDGYWVELGRHYKNNNNNLFHFITKGDGIIYHFTQDTFSTCNYTTAYINNKFIAETTTAAYCRDGNVYSYENNEILFSYSLITIDWLDEAMQNLIDAGFHGDAVGYVSLKTAAEEGKLISINTPETAESLFFKNKFPY